MKQVWRLQWATDRGLKEFEKNGTVFYTGDHLEKVINETYDQGFKDGQQQGRFDFRNDLEKGSLLTSYELGRLKQLAIDYEMSLADKSREEIDEESKQWEENRGN